MPRGTFSLTRRAFLRGALASGLAVAAGSAVTASSVDTHDLELPVVRLNPGLSRPWRIAVLGDIHFDPLYEETYLEAVVDQVSVLRPDAVFFLGDFITHTVNRIEDAARILGGAKSRVGSFAILGNHDYWFGAPTVTRHLEANGIRVLRNENVPLPGEPGCYVTGLASFWGGRPDPSVISRTPPGSRHLLLVHEPDPFVQLDDPRIFLQLSGHTHGGQVRLPFHGAIILPKYGSQFDAGLFSLGQRHLYVNRGVGTLRPHIRVNCQPEVTLLELT